MYENARYAVTETCLALTMFRSSINASTIVLFTGLLFMKAFHWLAQVGLVIGRSESEAVQLAASPMGC